MWLVRAGEGSRCGPAGGLGQSALLHPMGTRGLLVRLTHPLREQGAEASAGAAAHLHLDQGGVAFRLACGTGRAQLHLQVCMLKKLTPTLGVVGQHKQSLL